MITLRQAFRELIGRRLKEAREYLGLSTEMVCGWAGLTAEQLTATEAGAEGLPADQLAEFAALYRRPPGWFFEETIPEIGESLAGCTKPLSGSDAVEVAKFTEFLKGAGPAPAKVRYEDEVEA